MRRKRKTKALAPQLPAAGVGTALRSGPPQNLRDVLGCDGRVVERLTAAADPRGVADLPRAARQTRARRRGVAWRRARGRWRRREGYREHRERAGAVAHLVRRRAFSRKARWSARGAVGRGERSYVDVGGDAREEEVLGDAPQLCAQSCGGGGGGHWAAPLEKQGEEKSLHIFPARRGLAWMTRRTKQRKKSKIHHVLRTDLESCAPPVSSAASGWRAAFDHWSPRNPLSTVGTHGERPTCSREPAASGVTRQCGGRVGRGTS